MKMKFKHCQPKRIRKLLSGFHGKERTDLYKIFTAIAYMVCTGCQWKMLTRYLMGRKFPSPRPLVGAFLHLFRSRWNPIAPSRVKENHSTIDRPAVNIYCRTGSKPLPIEKYSFNLRQDTVLCYECDKCQTEPVDA